MHGLYQSSFIYLRMLKILPSIENDCTVFMPRCNNLNFFNYHIKNSYFRRIPYVWEDDYEMNIKDPWWDCNHFTKYNGLSVLNFHPIHVYLNSCSMENYENLKDKFPKLTDLNESMANKFIFKGLGAASMFFSCLNFLKNKDTFKIHDLK